VFFFVFLEKPIKFAAKIIADEKKGTENIFVYLGHTCRSDFYGNVGCLPRRFGRLYR
jgi:hypothetical protein